VGKVPVFAVFTIASVKRCVSVCVRPIWCESLSVLEVVNVNSIYLLDFICPSLKKMQTCENADGLHMCVTCLVYHV